MITKKVRITKVIVHDLMLDRERNILTYMIGNDINRKVDYDFSITLGENIMNHENNLILEDIENKEEPYWYNGVTRLFITGNYGNFIAVP